MDNEVSWVISARKKSGGNPCCSLIVLKAMLADSAASFASAELTSP